MWKQWRVYLMKIKLNLQDNIFMKDFKIYINTKCETPTDIAKELPNVWKAYSTFRYIGYLNSLGLLFNAYYRK